MAGIRECVGSKVESGTAAHRYELERHRSVANDRNMAAGREPARDSTAVQRELGARATGTTEQTGVRPRQRLARRNSDRRDSKRYSGYDADRVGYGDP